MLVEGVSYDLRYTLPDTFLVIMLMLAWFREEAYQRDSTEIDIKLYL